MTENGHRALPNSGFSNTFSTYVTLLGFSAGNSDFWRFPFLVYRNGGGAFLIPFIFTTIISGIPLFFLEYTFSKFSGKGPYRIWDISPLFRGIGVAILTTVFLFTASSTMFRAWLIYFFVHSFTSPLPWTHCNNTWNTNSCLTSPFADKMNHEMAYNEKILQGNKNITTFLKATVENTTRMTAAEEFWQYETLRLSTGLADFGVFNWRIFSCIAVFRIMIFLCQVKSIKSIEKVMTVTTFIQFGFTLVVFIRSLTLPGATDGLARFFLTDISKLGEFRIWVEAFLMSFYTMSIGWGSVITMGSHAHFKENSLRTSILIPSIDAFVAIMTGVVCFTVLGNMAHVYGVSVDEVVNAGVSLGMVSYLTGFSALPFPNLWSAGFIFSVILTGLDTQVVLVEENVQILGEMFPNLYPRYRLTTLIIYSLALVILALPTATGAGAYIFLWVEWYAGSWLGPICAFLEIIAVVWVYGIDSFCSDVTLMTGRPIPGVIRIILSFVTPCFVLLIFIMSAIRYVPPSYGSYHYPDWARALGWFTVVCIFAPISITALRDLCKISGSFSQRFRKATKSNENWGPKENSVQKDFERKQAKLQTRTMAEIAYFALFGQYRHRAEPLPVSELSFMS